MFLRIPTLLSTPAISGAISYALPFAMAVVIMVGIEQQPAKAQENASPPAFAVTITNYVVDQDQPIGKHRILFSNSIAYDFDEQNKDSITVFDPMRNRVVLLSRSLKGRCIVSTEDLTRFVAQLRVSADTPEKRLLFGLNAKVESKSDETYAIRFGGMNYSTTTQPAASESAALQFGQFADWASRLNMARKLGPPAFGRMNLNQAIAKKGQLPLELHLTIKRNQQAAQFRSTHKLTNQLSENDRKAIDEVSGMIALYRETPLKQMP